MNAANDIAEMYYKSRLPKFIKKKRMDNEYRKLQEIVDNYENNRTKSELCQNVNGPVNSWHGKYVDMA